MTSRRVLVIEDNIVTRKMMRAALESEHTVVEAPDARTALVELANGPEFDIVLLDLKLPDRHGTELVKDIRALAMGAQVPIVTVTGHVSEANRRLLAAAGITEVLIKPVESMALLEVVRSVTASAGQSQSIGRGIRILVVDDDPVSMNLILIHLHNLGFETTTASDGQAGLDEARERLPNLILSDILMPALDGFQFCRAVREDPLLGGIPVVLVSANYRDEMDRGQAERSGASDFVCRSDGPAAIIRTIQKQLAAPTSPAPMPDGLDPGYTLALRRQLDHQLKLNETLRKHNRLHAAAASVMRVMAEGLRSDGIGRQAVAELLALSLDAAGLPRGVLYLLDSSGRLALDSQLGYEDERRAVAEAFFGQPELFAGTFERTERDAIVLLSRCDPSAWPILDLAEANSALLVAIRAPSRNVGVMFLASDAPDLRAQVWPAFAGSIAGQIGLGIDIVQLYDHIAASERRHRGLMEGASDGMFILDRAGVIQDLNAPAEKLWQRSREQLMGSLFFDHLSKDEVEVMRDAFLTGPGAAGLQFHDKHLVQTQGPPRCVDVAVSGVQLEQSAALIVSVRDTTERNRLERELSLSQKMESIGRLAGGIAHDFNNMLTVMTGFASMVLESPDLADSLRPSIQEIKDAGDRSTKLTRQLLAYGRRQRLAPVAMDLKSVIPELSLLLRRLVGETIELKFVSCPEDAHVLADPTQIGQVVLNLVANSRDALTDGGRLTVEVARAILTAPLATETTTVPPGAYAVLTVADDGLGMDSATLACAFEPFFTTKPVGLGTGLGLSVVQGIVKQSHGHILVKTGRGEGCRIQIYLPLLEGSRDAVEPAVRPSLPPRGTETILVVDDEGGVRRLVASLLRAQGYTVIEAFNGIEAMKLAGRYSGLIHVLLTDILMPGMGGLELARQLIPTRPGLRILLMSGFAHEVRGDDLMDLPYLQVVAKPFHPLTLGHKIRELLRQPVPAMQAELK